MKWIRVCTRINEACVNAERREAAEHRAQMMKIMMKGASLRPGQGYTGLILRMRIGLHDAEMEHFKHKTFPNLALMKISAYHKQKGDQVEWWNPLYRYDRVYSSKVFDFTPIDPYLPDDAIRGGTGYSDIPIDKTLPDEVDNMFPDYSIYPECDYAIGYLTRGCINKCRWCVVPRKEGNIRPYRKWQDIVRDDSDKLV